MYIYMYNRSLWLVDNTMDSHGQIIQNVNSHTDMESDDHNNKFVGDCKCWHGLARKFQ